MNVVWCVLLIVLLVAELSSANLTTIWFACGALIAWIVSLLRFPLWFQLVVFFLVSVISLILTRPLVKKVIERRMVPTNADRAVGKEAWVTTTIDNIRGEGIVNLEGSEWSAISENGEVLAAGDKVIIKEIRGVKLVVGKAE